MKIAFTIHVKDKLQEKESKDLEIDREKIINVLKHPIVIDKNKNPHQSVGSLNEKLSLSVIWKVENDIIKAITFYPAEKGRYESKILRRR